MVWALCLLLYLYVPGWHPCESGLHCSLWLGGWREITIPIILIVTDHCWLWNYLGPELCGVLSLIQMPKNSDNLDPGCRYPRCRDKLKVCLACCSHNSRKCGGVCCRGLVDTFASNIVTTLWFGPMLWTGETEFTCRNIIRVRYSEPTNNAFIIAPLPYTCTLVNFHIPLQ